jgi:hypothetical protein
MGQSFGTLIWCTVEICLRYTIIRPTRKGLTSSIYDVAQIVAMRQEPQKRSTHMKCARQIKSVFDDSDPWVDTEPKKED